jgi:CD209 antigen
MTQRYFFLPNAGEPLLRISFYFFFFFHLGPLLGYKKHLTPSQLTIQLVPLRVEENINIFLSVFNLPKKLQVFAWHKGVLPLEHLKIASHSFLTNSTTLGYAYYDRVKVRNDGSLLLFNVKKKDAGLYTLRTVSVDLISEWAIIDLQVNSK